MMRQRVAHVHVKSNLQQRVKELMPKSKNRPAWWLSAKEFRILNQWIRGEIICWLDYHRSGLRAGVLVNRITNVMASSQPGPPDGYFRMPTEKRASLIWRVLNGLMEEREVEYFTDRADGLMHVRRTNVLDQMAYALGQEDS